MSTTTVVDPFAAKIAEAEARKANKQLHQEQLAAERKAAREAAATKYEAEQAAEAHSQMLVSFGHNVLQRVADRVVRSHWQPDYIRQIQAYSESLIRVQDVELPRGIDDSHVDAIFEQFERALGVFSKVPDGYFYGQRLLADRKASKASSEKPKRIRYTAPALRDHSQEPARQGATVIELRPAFTVKGTKGGRPTPAIFDKKKPEADAS